MDGRYLVYLERRFFISMVGESPGLGRVVRRPIARSATVHQSVGRLGSRERDHHHHSNRNHDLTNYYPHPRWWRVLMFKRPGGGVEDLARRPGKGNQFFLSE